MTRGEPWHVMIERMPADAVAGGSVQLAGQQCAAVEISRDSDTALGVSFDDAVTRLSRLERMFIEPDGSFVWRGGEHEGGWQLDGQLHDGRGSLAGVELKGGCPEQQLVALLAIFDSPATPLLIRLMRQGVAVSEDQWRRSLRPCR